MNDQFVEIDGKTLCPCGSTKTYQRCCKKKSFKWGYENNKLIRSVPIQSEVIKDALKARFQLTNNLYGRDPFEDELLFGYGPLDAGSFLLEMYYAMKESEIDERIAYAYYKSDGLLPTVENRSLISENDLKEFDEYCNEYDNLLSEPIKEGAVNRLQFSNYANSIITEIFDRIGSHLSSSMHDFINRHAMSDRFENYEISTVTDYCVFSLFKTTKVLDSIRKLIEIRMTESIIALSRGLYENYVYLNAININKCLFQEKILPKVNVSEYDFVKRDDGSIDFGQVVHIASGKTTSVHISFSELRKYLCYDEDKLLYSLFYQPACQYVHMDVLSAKSYFYVHNPYEEISPALMGGIIALTFAALVFEQVIKAEGVQLQFKKDASFLLQNVKRDLLLCYETAIADTKHQNAVYQTFLDRLQRAGS